MNHQEKLDLFFDAIKDQLEPGVIIESSRTQGSGKAFRTFINGRMSMEIPEALNSWDPLPGQDFKLTNVVSEIVREFPRETLVHFTISKENGFRYQAADAELLLRLIVSETKAGPNQDKKEEVLVKFSFDEEEDELNLDIVTKIEDESGPREFDFASADREMQCLYSALDKKLETLYVYVSKDETILKSIPEIPGLTTLYTPPAEDLTLDVSKLEDIYAFMESGSEAKANKAIEALNSNPNFKAKAEKRYLNLIKNRIGDNAGLESFAQAALTKKEINKLESDHFDKNHISLSYFDKRESEMAVAFIGALVMNHLDIADFQKKAEACTAMIDLGNLYSSATKAVKKGMLEEAKTYPDGWFSSLSVKFANHYVTKVLFENTSFWLENSPQLKAFVFYLNLNHLGGVYLDVFQSQVKTLTEFFWFLPTTPKSSWGETDLAIPKSTLKFPREASYRINDDGKWQALKSHE
ncbi:hypothetical protein HUK80_00210 [Flavobacterium sp. MAH-1]|uniref:Uncharacterized protein n=1 Tax=Flavobacterium agri TaxID=2743471 RepID=A0A7Y8XYQ5_9FLAO|nr:hypothetical protein [Flavobacterium agri]NUY79299.1 hypothetical protein [Flavobacterium agri]NYA69323.1 hypothetical protein [Flavobacterium agri]